MSLTRLVGHYLFGLDNSALMPSIYLGTFWYHSHLSTQYCDGLRGPLVVYDPHDPLKHLYDVDDGMLSLPLPSRARFILNLNTSFL